MVRRIATFIEPQLGMLRAVDRSVVLSNVAIGYNRDTPVAEDISVRFAPGERVVIVGANGSGKTTLANVLAGHLPQLAGDLAAPKDISAVTMPIAFPPLAVRELVSDDYLLKELGLDDPSIVENCADELSTGQQQKVAIAMALSKQADLYIFDEPLAGLDRESHKRAIDLILKRVKGKTLIVIMHGFQEYHGRFDRAGVRREGEDKENRAT